MPTLGGTGIDPRRCGWLAACCVWAMAAEGVPMMMYDVTWIQGITALGAGWDTVAGPATSRVERASSTPCGPAAVQTTSIIASGFKCRPMTLADPLLPRWPVGSLRGGGYGNYLSVSLLTAAEI